MSDTVVEQVVYDDIEPPTMIPVVKESELAWIQCKEKSTSRLASRPENTWVNFIPSGINDKNAMGLVYEDCNTHKGIVVQREVQQFAQQWRTTLMRCRHQIQWEEINKRFMTTTQNDEMLKEAARLVFEDKALQAVKQSLPEARTDFEDKETEGLRKEYVVRSDPTHVVSRGAFGQEPDEEGTNTFKVMMINHTKKEHKRVWKVFETMTNLQADTYPCGWLSQTGDKRMVAYRVTPELARVVVYNGPNPRVDIEQDIYIRVGGNGLLSCRISPDETKFALCDEFRIYTWSKGDKYFLIHFLQLPSLPEDASETEKHLPGMGAMCLSANGELVFGTTMGQVYRVNLQSRTLSSYNKLPDSLAILGVVRVGSKTIVNTIQDIFIVESHISPDEMIQIKTRRPMCLAAMGTRILSFDKFGHLLIFSTIHREMMTEVPMDDAKCKIIVPLPWYDGGLYTSPDAKRIGVLYPDGMVKIVGV